MKLLLTILSILISSHIASAQQEIDVSHGDPYFISSTDTISGYGPDHIVRDLLQDRKGNIWLASWLGIIEYDGKRFINHTLKDGLIKFHVVCCYEDRKGNLWFGTARGGVYRYDGKSFKLFTTKDGLVNNNIGSIVEDKAGNIWFGTEKGVSRYDNKTFKSFTAKNGLTGSFINSIVQDKLGNLWFGSSEGLYMFDGKTFTKKKGLPFERITGLLADSKGNLWVGSFDGLVRYDAGSKTCKKLLGNLLTYYIIEDAKGNIWFTQSEQNKHYTNIPNQVLYKYNARLNDKVGQGKTFTKVEEKDQPNDFQIFGKTVDRDGNIWFGTMHGPCRYDGKTFKYFTN